jgi:hypothetical protein
LFQGYAKLQNFCVFNQEIFVIQFLAVKAIKKARITARIQFFFNLLYGNRKLFFGQDIQFLLRNKTHTHTPFGLKFSESGNTDGICKEIQ